MQWSAALQVNGFNPALSYVSHYTGGMWNTQTPTAAILVGGAYSLALTGVTSFSPFAVFDRNTSTGIADIRNQKTLNIYPNPSNTFIHLANIEENTTYHLSIYDMTGQLILDQDASSNQLNISKLNDGIYAISINQNGNNFVSRMVVSK